MSAIECHWYVIAQKFIPSSTTDRCPTFWRDKMELNTTVNDTDQNIMSDANQKKSGSMLKRFLPVLFVLSGLAAGYAAGLHEYLSLSALAEQRDVLQTFVSENLILASAMYFFLYIAAVAFSFPAASILTIFGGFLFGWFLGGVLTAVGATIGAAILFKAAQTAFGDFLRDRAGPFAAKLSEGFQKDAFSYMVILRLAPVFPFFVMNIVPALFKIPLRTYMGATIIGILPGTFAYTYLGQGVDSVLMAAAQSGQEASVSDLVTPEITIAFAALAAVATIPSIVRRFRNK